jgi:surface polysaccharide O-acyltransferase-like enzyme
MSDQREAWLDVLHSVSVTLVIFLHSFWPFAYWLWKLGSRAHWRLFELNGALELARMPAFFLCSGLLFAKPMHRG